MLFLFFFNDTATTEIYTLSLHDALPILKAKKMTAKAENSGKQWSAKEDERLRELAVSSATLSEIAEKLNRTKSATQARAYTLRVGLRRFRTQRRSLSKWG